jgi:glyoxylase-like metal-dependent hydrolase (beta-lactamase superfamily II)
VSDRRRRRELARTDRIMPGVWRLRLPLPWPAVPHVNAWALAAGDGVVLVDTGYAGPGAMGQLERALDGAGLRLEHIRLVACTHAHPDHYGLAGPIVDAAGCELWMHPNHQHVTESAADPEASLAQRIEVARHSGVPEAALEGYEASRRGQHPGLARVVLPDRELLPGVTIETDLGPWDVYETPGHAPSHVVLHQADLGLLISGDHLLGRVSLYFDWGHTHDPVGEFLRSLDTIEPLDVGLCLAGHGRPFRDVQAHINANRLLVGDRVDAVYEALSAGPLSPFDVVSAIAADTEGPALVSWRLPEALGYLRLIELQGEAVKLDGDPERWALV